MPDAVLTPKRRRGRVLWLAVLSFLLVGGVAGTYGLYKVRTRQNTRKLLTQAREAAADGEWDAAVLAYRRYVRRQPGDVEALRAYVDALLEGIKTTPEVAGHAVRALRRLVRMEPDDVSAVEKLTGLYLSFRRYELAKELARRWAALDPRSAGATLALAVACNRLHTPSEAAEVLVAALDRNPRQPSLYPLLIKLLAEELGRPDEAARRLKDALRVGADAANVQLAAFAFHERQGDTELAEKHLQRALELAPDSLDALLPAVQFHLSHDRLAETEALLERAARIAADNRSVLALKASGARQKWDVRGSAAAADELTNRADDADVELIAGAAELYLRATRPEQARECLSKLESLPDAPERLGVRLDMLRAALALQRREGFAAIPHLRAALRREPSNARAVRLLAAAYAQTGDLDGAAEAFQRISQIARDDVSARLRFAEFAWRQGRLTDIRNAVGSLTEAGGETAQRAELIMLACELKQAKRAGSPQQQRGGLREPRESLLSRPPPDASSMRWAIRCLVLLGRVEQVIELLNRETLDDEAAMPLGAEVGRLLLSEGFVERALEFSDELVRRYPEAAESHGLRVKALAATGRLPDAVKYVEAVRLPSQAEAQVLETLADAQLAADREEPALKRLRQAAGLAPANVHVRQKIVRSTSDLREAAARVDEIRAIEGDAGSHWRFELAGALLRLDPSGDSVTRAIELVEQCLTDRPRWVSARLMLGYASELNGDLHGAAEAYQIVMAQRPNLRNKPLAIRTINLLKRLARFTEVDVLLDSLAAAAPDEPEVLRLQMGRQLRRRDFHSALATAERLVHLHPEDPAWAATAADLHLRLGNAEDAEAITRTALARVPGSVPLLWSLAQALIAQGRGVDAETEVRSAVAADDDDASHQLLLAHVLAKLGRPSQAEHAVARALELEPQSADVWAASADFWGMQGRRTRQIDCARRAVTLRGDDPRESLQLARLLVEQRSSLLSNTTNERREAERIVSRRLQRNPDDVASLLLRAKLALAAEPADTVRAEADVKRALRTDLGSPDAHRLLAAAKMRGGDSLAAGEAIATGLAFAPNNAELLLGAAEIHCHRGEYEQAIAPLQHFLDLRPRTPHALQLLTTALHQTGRVDRAIELLERIGPLDAATAGELLILARLYEISGEVDRAEDVFLAALKRNEDSGDVFRGVVQFYARRLKFQEIHALAAQRREELPADVESLILAAGLLGAQSSDPALSEVGMGWLEEVARTRPEHAAKAVLQSGTCCYQRGDLNTAESRFLQAIRRAPGAREPVNALAWLYAVDMDRPADARTIIEKFLTSGGHEDAALMDTYGVVLMKLGEFETARRRFEECIRIVGETSTKAAANYHLGLVLRKLGRPREAVAHIERGRGLAERLGGLTHQERAEAERLVAEAGSKASSDIP